MVDKIYVVMGTTGKYSDRTEWLVAAYSNEKEAQKHIELATEKANEEFEKYRKDVYKYDPKNEYDKGMAMDYTGTRYFLEESELFEDVFHYKLML